MKIDVISGFLGAGKTTLIKKLLSESLKNEKVAIVENEYGEVGIDGTALSNSQVKVSEINSGCICCSILGDFKKELKNIINEYKPDRVIIEPSGVAKLSQILNSITSEYKENILNIVACVIDVKTFETYMNNFGEFYRDQVQKANTIILSKTNEVNNKHINLVAKGIRKINPNCFIISTEWDKLSAKQILDISEQKNGGNIRDKMIIKTPLNNVFARTGKAATKHKTNDIFETFGEECAAEFSIEELKERLSALRDKEKYGFVIRAKGIVKTDLDKWIIFDYVSGDLSIADFNIQCSGRICFIGTNLNKDAIRNMFLYGEL